MQEKIKDITKQKNVLELLLNVPFFLILPTDDTKYKAYPVVIFSL